MAAAAIRLAGAPASRAPRLAAVPGSLGLPHLERIVIAVWLLAGGALLYLLSGWMPELDWAPALLGYELVAGVTPLAYAARRGRLDICETLPILLLGFLLHFWLRPLYDLFSATLPRADLTAVLRLAAVCLPLAVFVYWLPPRRFFRTALPIRDRGAVVLRLLVVAGIGAVGWTMVIRSHGGLDSILTRKRQMFAMISHTRTIYFEPLRLFLTVAVLALGGLILAGRVRSRFVRAGTLVFLGLYGFALFRIGGSRLPLANLIFALLVQYHYLIRRVTLRLVLALSGVLFVLAGALGTYRSNFQFRSYRTMQELEALFSSPDRFLADTVGSPDYAMFDTTAKVMRLYPHVVPYSGGASYLKLLFTPIPREIWPEKPENLSREAVRMLGSGEDYVEGVSLSVSYIGEGYMNFGPAGAVAATAFIALLFRAIYSWFSFQPRSIASVCIYSAGLLSLVFNVLRGTLQTNLVEYAIATAAAAFIWTVSGRCR